MTGLGIVAWALMTLFSIYAGVAIGRALHEKNKKKVVVLFGIWLVIYMTWMVWYFANFSG